MKAVASVLGLWVVIAFVTWAASTFMDWVEQRQKALQTLAPLLAILVGGGGVITGKISLPWDKELIETDSRVAEETAVPSTNAPAVTTSTISTPSASAALPNVGGTVIEREEGCRGHRAGVRVAYAKAPTSTAPSQIWSANAEDGSDARPLLPYGDPNVDRSVVSDLSPDWRPDGSRLAFERRIAGTSRIYLVDSDGTGLQPLLSSHLPGVSDVAPAWSPDCARIAFVRQGQTYAHVYVANADGSGLEALTAGPVTDGSPSWSPDGSRIAFHRYRGNSRDVADIFILQTRAPAQVVPLIMDGTGNYAPSWSPSGDYIAFHSSRNDPNAPSCERCVFNIFRVAVDDPSDLVAVTSGNFRDTFPAWSPDGSKVAFQANRATGDLFDDSRRDIYVIAAGSGTPPGSEQLRVTQDPALHSHPAW